jgi:hypothetical protein
MLGRWARGSGTAARALVVLAAVCCCLAAAAYAATKPGVGSGSASGRGATRPLQPRFTQFPAARTEERLAEVDFAQPPRPPARARPGRAPVYECRLDGEGWEACEGPVALRGLALGGHRFAVRAVDAAGRSGPADERSWRVVKAEPATPAPSPEAPAAVPSVTVAPSLPVVPPEEEKAVIPPEEGPLRVTADTSALAPLLPGAAAQPLPVTIENESSEPALITSLEVVAVSPVADCAVDNFELGHSGVSTTLPLEVPAEGSASLPAPGIAAPTLAMRALPVDQDPCQGIQLQLYFDAEAEG